jgi:hypothetical protein
MTEGRQRPGEDLDSVVRNKNDAEQRVRRRARQTIELNSHISYEEVREAVRFVDEMLLESEPVIRMVAGEA